MCVPADYIDYKKYDDDYYLCSDEESDNSDDSSRFWRNARKVNSIYDAVVSRDLDELQIQIDSCIKDGKSLNVDDATQKVPLIEACLYSWENGVSRLLHAGADPNASHGMMTPLLACCHSQANQETAKCAAHLLEFKADPSYCNQHGRQPLMVACFCNAECVVAVLLSCEEVDIHATDPFGRTALFYAMMSGNEEIIQRLLKAGVDPLVKASDGTIAEEHRFVDTKMETDLPVSCCFVETPVPQNYSLDGTREFENNRLINDYLLDVLNNFPSKASQLFQNYSDKEISMMDVLQCDEEILKECGVKLSYYRRKIIHLLNMAYVQKWKENSLPPSSLQNDIKLTSIGNIVHGMLGQIVFMQGWLNLLKSRFRSNPENESYKNTLAELVDLYVAQKNLLRTLLRLQNELKKVKKIKKAKTPFKKSWDTKIFNVILIAVAAPLVYIFFKSKFATQSD